MRRKEVPRSEKLKLRVLVAWPKRPMNAAKALVAAIESPGYSASNYTTGRGRQKEKRGGDGVAAVGMWFARGYQLAYLVFGEDLHRVVEDGDLDHEEAGDEEDALYTNLQFPGVEEGRR